MVPLPVVLAVLMLLPDCYSYSYWYS